MHDNLDYSNSHYCPVYDKEIDIDLCYDSLCCLNGTFAVGSVKELESVKGIEQARKKCAQCPYSDLS